MLRIGFVGAGLMGWAHALGVQALVRSGTVDATVVGVHDVDADRARGFAAVNGTEPIAALEELVDRCDALWVCTPTAAHGAAVAAAAERGVAVFCEKPLAVDLAGARAMERAVSSAGIPAQVGLVLRSTPVFGALRALLASGELGRPMAAVLRDDQYFPVQGLYRSAWRGDVTQAGGGCLIEHSIHDVDILRFCLGEVTGLSGTTANFAGRPGVEDVAVASLRFASGATGELVSVWHDVLSRGSTRRLEVLCQGGVVWLDDEYTGPLHVQTSEGVEARVCAWPTWTDELGLADDEVGLAVRAYVGADRAFLDAVTQGRPPEPSFAEAVVAHELVDGVYRSAADGGAPVELPRRSPPTGTW